MAAPAVDYDALRSDWAVFFELLGNVRPAMPYSAATVAVRVGAVTRCPLSLPILPFPLLLCRTTASGCGSTCLTP